MHCPGPVLLLVRGSAGSQPSRARRLWCCGALLAGLSWATPAESAMAGSTGYDHADVVTAAAPACERATPATAAGYQRMFDAKNDWTWSGGDQAATVRLPDGRTLWLFADTIQGRGRGPAGTPPAGGWCTTRSCSRTAVACAVSPGRMAARSSPTRLAPPSTGPSRVLSPAAASSCSPFGSSGPAPARWPSSPLAPTRRCSPCPPAAPPRPSCCASFQPRPAAPPKPPAWARPWSPTAATCTCTAAPRSPASSCSARQCTWLACRPASCSPRARGSTGTARAGAAARPIPATSWRPSRPDGRPRSRSPNEDGLFQMLTKENEFLGTDVITGVSGFPTARSPAPWRWHPTPTPMRFLHRAVHPHLKVSAGILGHICRNTFSSSLAAVGRTPISPKAQSSGARPPVASSTDPDRLPPFERARLS